MSKLDIKFKRLTPFKRCVLQNFPFIEEDFDTLKKMKEIRNTTLFTSLTFLLANVSVKKTALSLKGL